MTSLFQSLTKYDEVFNRANHHFNEKRYRQAKADYEQAYTLHPNWRTAYGLGLACAQLGQIDDAIRYYREATLHDATALEPRVNLSNLLIERDEYTLARFHQLVAYSINSGHPMISHNLGMSMQKLGEPLIARELFARSLQADPKFAQAKVALTALGAVALPNNPPASTEALAIHQQATARPPSERRQAIAELEALIERRDANSIIIVDLGNLYLADGMIEKAIETQKAAIERNGLLAAAFHNLGAAQQAAGQQEEAILTYQRSLSLAPQLGQSWLNYGRALVATGRLDLACDCFLRAEALMEQSAEAIIEFANTAHRLRRAPEAIEAMRRLKKVKPDDFMVANNLGTFYLDQNRFDESLACFEEAARLNPQSGLVRANIGTVHELRGDFARALVAYRAARDLMPESSNLLTRILHMSQHECDWNGIEETFAALIRLVRAEKFEGVNPFSLLPVPGVNRIDQLKCARAFTKDRLGFLEPMRLPPVAPRARRNKRIKVGYLSSDLYDHATSWLVAEIIELHDRERFEVVAYSYGPGYDTPMRARLKKGFDRFVELRDVTDEQAAHMIRTDEIDVLIDLKGYTQGCRTGILALRPAPVQINYLGFPGSMGAEFIDWIVADDVVIPEAFSDGYSEKILRMPVCYQPNDRKRALPPAPTRAAAGLPAEGFVFCTFNNVYKITPEVFDVWCRLLRETPGSVLWVLSSNMGAFANLRAEARKRDVEPERLILAPRLTLADHLARFRLADIFVDTFPCAAHTTASDSLWAGVPVVTLVGDTFASRVAASLLRAVGMPELAASTLDDYFRIAKGLADDPARLRGLKERLEAERMTNALFDSVVYTRALDDLIAQAFEAWLKQDAA